ncbi:MAG: NAD(P)H-dependent oxidoreductase [Bacteroidales bacterium]|nr:NAD(P)H-dependent oxidoreductase [Bacteroidales bacterium]
MKLSIINGSPRGKLSNTSLLLEKFKEGFLSVEKSVELKEAFVKSKNEQVKLINMFLESDILIIAFPLYTDAMPGIMKSYFEILQPYQCTNPKLRLGFIVQSGFPEAHHSCFISIYLKKLSQRLGVHYLGTAIRGGIEGIKIQPKWMTRKTYDLYYDLGQYLALDWEFNEKVLKKLAQPKHLSGFRLFNYKLLRLTGLADFYWNMQLKDNKAYELRFAKPYSNN